MGDYVVKNSEIISNDIRSKIAMRYHRVTKAVNHEFFDSESEVNHSLYVGSYGRGTAIDTSDIDILLELPQVEYEWAETIRGNGQSRLLQAVRNAVLTTYPNSEVRADGQIVKVLFSDGMRFELLPAFKSVRGLFEVIYKYPDSNMGGNWCATDPKAEQLKMKEKNKNSNGLFFDTCKHIRRIRDNHFKSYHLSGIVIDSFVYFAMGDWHWSNKDSGTVSTEKDRYESSLLKYFYEKIYSLSTPGSGDPLDIEKSSQCLEKVLTYMSRG